MLSKGNYKNSLKIKIFRGYGGKPILLNKIKLNKEEKEILKKFDECDELMIGDQYKTGICDL